MNSKLITFSSILLALSIVLTGCKNEKAQDFAGTGIIEATEITVSAESAGTVLALNVDEGDSVAAGDTLAVIDVENTKLQRNTSSADISDIDWNRKVFEKQIVTAKEAIEQTSIALDNTRTSYNRIKNLFSQNAATKDQLDRAETELSLAVSRQKAAKDQLSEVQTRMGALAAKHEKIDANLKLLDKQISDAVVTAPSNGSVIEKYSEKGEIVIYGKPLLKIADISKVWLKVYVSEEMLGKIKLGGKADVRIDSIPEKSFTGSITWISPKSEFTPKSVQTRNSRIDLVYAVKITIDNPDGIFKIGMPAEVYIQGL